MINQSLPIPEHKMGWMIGKSGSYLNQLCFKSGAFVSVSESSSKEYGRVWKYIQIKGSGRAVDKAKKLIHIRLERLEPRLDDIDGGKKCADVNDVDGRAVAPPHTLPPADSHAGYDMPPSSLGDTDQRGSVDPSGAVHEGYLHQSMPPPPHSSPRQQEHRHSHKNEQRREQEQNGHFEQEFVQHQQRHQNFRGTEQDLQQDHLNSVP